MTGARLVGWVGSYLDGISFRPNGLDGKIGGWKMEK